MRLPFIYYSFQNDERSCCGAAAAPDRPGAKLFRIVRRLRRSSPEARGGGGCCSSPLSVPLPALPASLGVPEQLPERAIPPLDQHQRRLLAEVAGVRVRPGLEEGADDVYVPAARRAVLRGRPEGVAPAGERTLVSAAGEGKRMRRHTVAALLNRAQRGLRGRRRGISGLCQCRAVPLLRTRGVSPSESTSLSVVGHAAMSLRTIPTNPPAEASCCGGCGRGGGGEASLASAGHAAHA